jgi:hypothetical protein
MDTIDYETGIWILAQYIHADLGNLQQRPEMSFTT